MIAVPTSEGLRGVDIVSALDAAGVEFVVTVPDIVTSEGLLRPIDQGERFRHVRVCKEDEGVSICGALSYCGRRSLLLMQHTGLLDSLNAVRAIAVDYQLPVCMMVGLQGMEPDRLPRDSSSYGVRIVEPVLEVMGLAYHRLRTGHDVAEVAPAIEKAYAASQPVVFLVARSPAP